MSAPLPNLSGGAPDGTLIVPSPSLPAELLGRLKTGNTVGGRVVRQLAAGRYLVNLGGAQVQAESRLSLSAGDRLILAVKDAGDRIVLDLVSRGAEPSPAAAARSTAEASRSRPSSGEIATGPDSPASGAARTVQAEAGTALARSQSYAELLAEAHRVLLPGARRGTGASHTASSPLQPEAAARAREILDALPLSIAGSTETVVPAEEIAVNGSAMRAALEGAPLRLLELISLVEAAAEKLLAEVPGAAALNALIELLAMLTPTSEPADGTPAGTPLPTLSSEVRAELAELLDRLLSALSAARPAGPEGTPELPAELLARLESLTDEARRALLELAAARERDALDSSPRLTGLSRAHRALTGLHQRTLLSRLGGLATSGPSTSFCYFELPVCADGNPTGARVRFSVRRGRPDSGQAPRAGNRRAARAVLDLRTSGLGEVWSEALLSGSHVAVRLQLPDPERRDFVTARLGELEERLTTHGLQPAVSAVAREKSEPGFPPATWPEADDDGRIDLWV